MHGLLGANAGGTYVWTCMALTRQPGAVRPARLNVQCDAMGVRVERNKYNGPSLIGSRCSAVKLPGRDFRPNPHLPSVCGLRGRRLTQNNGSPIRDMRAPELPDINARPGGRLAWALACTDHQLAHGGARKWPAPPHSLCWLGRPQTDGKWGFGLKSRPGSPQWR